MTIETLTSDQAERIERFLRECMEQRPYHVETHRIAASSTLMCEECMRETEHKRPVTLERHTVYCTNGDVIQESRRICDFCASAEEWATESATLRTIAHEKGDFWMRLFKTLESREQKLPEFLLPGMSRAMLRVGRNVVPLVVVWRGDA